MVQTSFLYPIVDAAACLGDDVLAARAAQNAFERRSVHKFAFTVAPLYGGGASTTTGGGGECGRGLAVLPELGQVVSVAGKSTLVCHRETVLLSYLRRSFLRIGRRAAWGEVCQYCDRRQRRTGKGLYEQFRFATLRVCLVRCIYACKPVHRCPLLVGPHV